MSPVIFSKGVTCHFLLQFVTGIILPMLKANQDLERGLLGVFSIVTGLRFLLWLLTFMVDTSRWLPDSVEFLPQSVIIMALLEGLLLIFMSWPTLRSKIGPQQFGWLLAISSAILLYGHGSVIGLRGDGGASSLSIYFTQYSMLLSVNMLFVAWQFNLRAVFLYFGAVLGTLFLFFWQNQLFANPELAISSINITLFVTLITMLLPGYLIAHLMTQQRQQRAALTNAAEEQARTNEQLVHYAASLEELTISRERNRLARELHDTLAHSLSAVTVQLGAVETLWENDPDEAKALLAQADGSARDGLDEARRALQALRASPLEDLGLVFALEALAKEAAARTNTTLHLDLPKMNLTFLEPHIEQSIYRVAQEALENSVRHASAKNLWVSLIESSEQLELNIKDDGQGFNQSASTPSGHFGITGMEERAHVIGGTLQVNGLVGEGTTVQLVVPLSKEGGSQS